MNDVPAREERPILDPAQKLDVLGSLLVVEGVVAAIGPEAERDPLAAAATEILNAGGKLLTPGFIDLHVHFRSRARRKRNHRNGFSRRRRRRFHLCLRHTTRGPPTIQWPSSN